MEVEEKEKENESIEESPASPKSNNELEAKDEENKEETVVEKVVKKRPGRRPKKKGFKAKVSIQAEDENAVDGFKEAAAATNPTPVFTLSSVSSDSNTEKAGEEKLKSEEVEQSQSGSDQQAKKKRRKRQSIFGIEPTSSNGQMSVSNLFIYKWPPEEEAKENGQSSETYVLQEQISEYLDVKSFKRKYPDLNRRLVDLDERIFLKENKVVTETQCDLGLNAILLGDFMDILADSYPDKYKEFNEHLLDKRRKSMSAAFNNNITMNNNEASSNNVKRKSEVGSMNRPGRAALSESEKMREMIKKAMKSASNFNCQFQKERKTERKAYFDLQSMRVQLPQYHNTKTFSSNPNSLGKYPVAVLQGQFQYYHKKYSSDELKHLPLNTIIYPPQLPLPFEYEEWKQQQQQHQNQTQPTIHTNPLKIDLSDEEEKIEIADSMKKVNSTSNQLNNPIRITVQPASNNNSNNVSKSASSTSLPIFTCNVCIRSDTEANLIRCSSCARFSHQNCLELNPKYVSWECIGQYDWQCMECKRCSKCENAHDEDRMMFCDRCDRGFHTYCVGLDEVPNGAWLCRTCKPEEGGAALSPSKKYQVLKAKLANSPILAQSSALVTPSLKRGRGRPPGSLNRPKESNSPKKVKTPTNKVRRLDQVDFNADEASLMDTMDESLSYGYSNLTMDNTISQSIGFPIDD